MSEKSTGSAGNVDLAQAQELAALVELEARWENLRHSPSRQSWDAGGRARVANLVAIQNAYASFRVKLVAYNKRYTPAHVPELLLNTPLRLGAWCRAMRALYLRVENDAAGLCPSPLLEKAYRCADRVSVLMKTAPVNRSTPSVSVRQAIEDLDALVAWCAELANVATTTKIGRAQRG
jgi:hypothetical protein